MANTPVSTPAAAAPTNTPAPLTTVSPGTGAESGAAGAATGAADASTSAPAAVQPHVTGVVSRRVQGKPAVMPATTAPVTPAVVAAPPVPDPVAAAEDVRSAKAWAEIMERDAQVQADKKAAAEATKANAARAAELAAQADALAKQQATIDEIAKLPPGKRHQALAKLGLDLKAVVQDHLQEQRDPTPAEIAAEAVKKELAAFKEAETAEIARKHKEATDKQIAEATKQVDEIYGVIASTFQESGESEAYANIRAFGITTGQALQLAEKSLGRLPKATKEDAALALKAAEDFFDERVMASGKYVRKSEVPAPATAPAVATATTPLRPAPAAARSNDVPLVPRPQVTRALSVQERLAAAKRNHGINT